MNDHSEIRAIEKRITETVAALQKLVPDYASARQVIDYDSDRRKQLLARHTSPCLIAGNTAAMADALARDCTLYCDGLDKLSESLKSAYEVQARWQALMARLDAARSLLAVSRETLKQMPEATGT